MAFKRKTPCVREITRPLCARKMVGPSRGWEQQDHSGEGSCWHGQHLIPGTKGPKEGSISASWANTGSVYVISINYLRPSSAAPACPADSQNNPLTRPISSFGLPVTRLGPWDGRLLSAKPMAVPRPHRQNSTKNLQEGPAYRREGVATGSQALPLPAIVFRCSP